MIPCEILDRIETIALVPLYPDWMCRHRDYVVARLHKGLQGLVTPSLIPEQHYPHWLVSVSLVRRIGMRLIVYLATEDPVRRERFPRADS